MTGESSCRLGALNWRGVLTMTSVLVVQPTLWSLW